MVKHQNERQKEELPWYWITQRREMDEQKGCRRQSSGTKDQLMVDKMVKKELQKKNDRLECCLDRL